MFALNSADNMYIYIYNVYDTTTALPYVSIIVPSSSFRTLSHPSVYILYTSIYVYARVVCQI